MKLNKKGFSVVELLGVVAILGVLSIVAIPSIAKFVNKARNTSMDTMMKSTYEAAQNYMMKKDIVLDRNAEKIIEIDTLVEEGFLEPLINYANNSSGECRGNVKVTRANDTAGGLLNYSYEIRIKCAGSGEEKIENFPK